MPHGGAEHGAMAVESRNQKGKGNQGSCESTPELLAIAELLHVVVRTAGGAVVIVPVHCNRQVEG